LRRGRSFVVDAEPGDDAAAAARSDLPTSLAEAEEAIARAESRAQEARARAAELRQQVEAADTTTLDEEADEAAHTEPSVARRKHLPQWLRRPPKQTTVAVGAALVIIATSLAASGYMVWQHVALMHEHKRAAEFKAAARAGVELMMSIDPDHARENVQRLIDNSTGAMQSQLRVTSAYLVEDMQKAKVSSKATAQDTAVDSMTNDSAVVLVIVKSDTTNPDKSKRPPAYWRLSVDLQRDDGQLKMSKVDFVQ
jgi:Mce-associated membrane protein